MAKWTARKLKSEIDGYFASISRTVAVKESVPTGQKDEYGHDIYQTVEVENSLGEPVYTEEWLLPPSIPDLLHELELTEEEWKDLKVGGKTAAVAEAAEKRIERYLRRELLTRPNKDIKGVMLTLQKDFGFGETAAEESGSTLEQLLGGGEA